MDIRKKLNMSRGKRFDRVASLLLNDKEATVHGTWPGLTELNGRPADKKSANRFFLGAILDYRIPAETAWANASWLVDYLGNPNDLWGAISDIPLETWSAQWSDPAYRLHRYPKGHERVWTIGQRISKEYGGDARRIWRGLEPAKVLTRLEALKVGAQIARMIVGALRDTGQITGTGDVKADIHVRRVLGRVLTGDAPLTPEDATEVTRAMYPDDPWRLDAPLYWLGRRVCRAISPDHINCYLNRECLYYAREQR